MIAAIICVTSLKAQKLTSTEVKQMLNAKHFSFEPITMIPQAGATKQLTSEFFLKVSGDSLISYLPYFGRALFSADNCKRCWL